MSKRPRPDVESDEKNTPYSSASATVDSYDSSAYTVNHPPLPPPSSPSKFTRLSEEPSSPSSSLNINLTTTGTKNPTSENVSTGTNTSVNTTNQGNTNTNGNTILLTCNLPSCPTSTRQFLSSEEYEVHYTQAHMNRCVECLRNFPSLKMLECHIKENHDMLSRVKREKGEKIVSHLSLPPPFPSISF